MPVGIRSVRRAVLAVVAVLMMAVAVPSMASAFTYTGTTTVPAGGFAGLSNPYPYTPHSTGIINFQTNNLCLITGSTWNCSAFYNNGAWANINIIYGNSTVYNPNGYAVGVQYTYTY